ncbi:MAG: hypothetical protein V1765_02065 [bacterium]
MSRPLIYLIMIGIIKQLTKNKPMGFSIAEVVVAVSIFAVIMVIAIDSFINVIAINRESRQYQALQDHARFLYEMISKELRTAQVNLDGNCNPDYWGHTSVYNVETVNGIQNLYFRNYHDQCVHYYLGGTNNDVLMIDRDDQTGIIMPRNIKVKDLKFDVTNFEYDKATNNPPSVTFYMKLESIIWNPPMVELQSTITARYIE